MLRTITSEAFGRLGTFKLDLQTPDLWRGRTATCLVGTGNIGGKAKGHLFLEKAQAPIAAQTGDRYEVPRTLIISNHYLHTQNHSVHDGAVRFDLETAKGENLQTILQTLGFSDQLAIRSSSPLEDTLDSSAPGRFDSEFFGKPFESAGAEELFRQLLSGVCNSAYSVKALLYALWKGEKRMPPLAVMIQELVGKRWEQAPTAFLPALSGIVDTSDPEFIRVVTVCGFAHPAASGMGGIAMDFTHNRLELGSTTYQGDYSRTCLDLARGTLDDFHYSTFPDVYRQHEQISERAKPALQKRLAAMAKALTARVGHPLSLEWASPEGSTLFLNQARPLPAIKGVNLTGPESNKPQCLLEAGHNNFIGTGEHVCTHVILCDFHDNPEMAELIRASEALAFKYPNSLLAINIKVTEGDTQKDLEPALALFRPVVIVEGIGLPARGIGRRGIDHFSLLDRESGRLIFYTAYDHMLGLISQHGKPLESIDLDPILTSISDYAPALITVYDFSDNPVHVVGDEKQEYARIFLEKPVDDVAYPNAPFWERKRGHIRKFA